MTIGERIKRRRQLRGWSVRLAADRAGISHASWSRIERGLQAADNRFVLSGIASALECSIVELTGAVMPAGDRRAAAAQLGVHAIRVALVEIDPEQAEAGPGRPVAELNEELALVRRLRHECDYARAVALVPRLLRDLQTAGRGPEKRVALRMVCEAAFLASSLLRSLGHPADAWLGAERCRDVAAETQDPVLLGLAAFARACAASACGSYDRELALAERGIATLDPHAGTPGALEMLGVLHLIGASASRSGDNGSWLTEAATIARRTGETTTFALYFGPANVNLWRLGFEADAGEPGRAVEIATTADVSAARVNSRVVFFHTDLARAYAGLRGRDQDAVKHLLAAERVAPQHVHSSPLVQETARSLLDRVQRRSGGTALRGLCERMRVAG